MKTAEKKPVKPTGKEDSYVNPFLTCDSKGRPVPFRFPSAKSLRDVYTKAQEDDVQDSARRARILGMYEAKLPWNPQKLEAAGLKDKANFNSNGLAGKINARSGAVANLALDTTDLVELQPIRAELSGPDADDIGDIVAEEFSNTLRTGMEFLPALATAFRECDLYGLGPIMWPDPEGYKPEAVLRGQVKLPPNAPFLSCKNEIIMVETQMSAADMFALFDYPEASVSAGWHLEAVRKYLIQVFSEGQDSTTQTGDVNGTSILESSIALMRQNRIFETRQFEAFRVINAFVREVSGDRKVSHYMIPALPTMDEFLCVKYNAFDDMDQCLIWLPYTVTENRAAGLRGLASFLLPIEDMRNRVICESMDAVRQSLRTQLTRDIAGGSTETLTVLEQGQYSVFPAGITPVQNYAAANMTNALNVVEGVSRAASANAAGENGVASANNRITPTADRRGKEEVLAEREQGEKTEQTLFITRSVVFDSVFRECFRRFMKIALAADARRRYPEVQKFVDRCEARGVDMGKLSKVPEFFELYMCRDLLTGGAAAKAGMLVDIIGGLGGNLDEKGRLDGTYEYVRCRMGSRMARRLRPKIGRDSMPSDSASHALLENNDILELSAVLAGPDQMHWSHIPIHGQLVKQISDAVAQNQVQDPQRMLDTLQLVSEHIQSHISYGGRQLGKEADAKAAMANLRGLRPVQQALTMMAQNVERVRRAQEEKAQKDQADLEARAEGKDNEVKIHEIDTKAALKMREQDLMHQARMTEADSKAQTDMFRAQMKAETERISANYNRLINASKVTGNAPPSTEGLTGTLA